METLAHGCFAKRKNKYFLSNYATVITNTLSEKGKHLAKMSFVRGEEILRRFTKKSLISLSMDYYSLPLSILELWQLTKT